MSLTVNSAPLGAVAPLTSDANLSDYAGQSASGVLAAVDVSGNSMSYAIATKPKNGTVSVTSTSGAFVYTPNAGFTGSDSFTFTATDTTNKLTSSPATISLTINPAPPAPARHGGPGGLGFLSLLLLVPLTFWRRNLVKPFQQRLALRNGILIAVAAMLFATSYSAIADQTPAGPHIPSDSWYAGAQINIIKPDSKRDASTNGSKGWDLLIGRQFGDYSLEFSYAYHADSPRNSSGIANWTAFGANGLWYFTHHNTGWFSPFVDTGIGLEKQYYGDNSTKKSPYLNLGAGFDSTFGNSMPFRLRTDLQLQHAFNGYNDLILSVGVVFPFGGTQPAWQQPAMPDSSPSNAYPMAWCTAKGGRPHRSDKGWVCLPPAATPKSQSGTD